MDQPSSRFAVPLVVLLVLLATLPGLAAAAPVQGAGSTIVVDSGETVDGVQAVAGTVIIRGTVTGDVEVTAGTLVISGTVQGDVRGAAGSVDIRGQVGGDVMVGTGSLTVAEDAVIDGRLQAGTGSARIAGTVGGDAAIDAGSIVLEPTATIQGDFRYDGELDDQGATVQGQFVRDRSLGGWSLGPFSGFGDALFVVYGFLVNLVLGAVLLVAFPAGSRGLANRVVEEPLTTGLYGLGGLVGIPILLLLVAITIIGIPLAIVGALLFALAVWIGSVYGRYAVGVWLLGSVGTENRWVALFVGMVAVAAVGFVPYLGGLVEFFVLLLGLGGLALGGLSAYRGRRDATGAS